MVLVASSAKPAPHSPARHDHEKDHGVKHHPAPLSKPKRSKLTIARFLHLAHRFVIFACAVGYVCLCFQSCYSAVGLLRGRDNPSRVSRVSSFDWIARLAGNGTIRESELIRNTALAGRTDPVNGTLYLQPNNFSFSKCPKLAGRQQDIFDDTFLRSLYRSIVSGTSYHITDIGESEVELIAPVVDCTTSDITDGDTTTGRFFFLARERADPEVVMLLIVSMSNQQYEIRDQGAKGAVGVATIQHVHDMREGDMETHYIASIGYPYELASVRGYEFLGVTQDGQWSLRSLPATEDEMIVTLETANREGFYIKAESEQSNINNAIWITESEPQRAIATWTWVSKPVLHDSWAWVHAVQFFIGMGLLSNLAILCLATYRNFRAGKWWIGDAFVSISTSQLVNGAAVLVSWFMNEYWVLHEFCFDVAFEVSDVAWMYAYEAPMRVDLLTIYLSACGLIGLLFKERVDPLLAAVCFHIGFDLRVHIIGAVPSIRDSIIEYATYSYFRGVNAAPPDQELISPMQLWSTHALGKRNYAFVARCIFPVFSTLPLILMFVGARKIYRRLHPETVHALRNTKGTVESSHDEAFTSQKRVLTLFEVATGAELENRFGLVSEYETCLFIKGMKFASADGIYSTGFLIANKRILLQTSDYWSIVLMKIIRRRYRNIYVYDVNGSTVQQTARLVYPHTLSFQDLANINISVLS